MLTRAWPPLILSDDANLEGLPPLSLQPTGSGPSRNWVGCRTLLTHVDAQYDEKSFPLLKQDMLNIGPSAVSRTCGINIAKKTAMLHTWLPFLTYRPALAEHALLRCSLCHHAS